MTILAIDPGQKESGVVQVNCTGHLIQCDILKNEHILSMEFDCTECVIEMIVSYGMPVGKETFDAVLFIGRLMQYIDNFGIPVKLYTRKNIKKTISSGSAKDSHIRQALIDMYPGTGGGKVPQIGTKKQPGPLYGMKSHMWSALAVAHAHLHGCGEYYYE